MSVITYFLWAISEMTHWQKPLGQNQEGAGRSVNSTQRRLFNRAITGQLTFQPGFKIALKSNNILLINNHVAIQVSRIVISSHSDLFDLAHD